MAPAKKDDISQGQIIAFGAVIWPLVIGQQSLSFLLPYYSQVLGLSLATIGLILTIARVYDAIWDTGIAYISDNTRSRWGKRKPWIVLGMIGFLPSVWFLFVPGGEVSIERYTLAVFLFFTFWTMAYIPVLSQATELTRDNVKRNSITLAQGIASTSALIIGMVLPFLLLDARTEGWRNAAADLLSGADLLAGFVDYLRMPTITGPERFGEIMFVIVWATSIALPITLAIYVQKVPAHPVGPKAPKASILAALRNIVFQRFFVGYALMMLGYMGRSGLLPFVVGFAFGATDDLLLLFLVQFVTTIVATPLWSRLMRRYERVTIVMLSAAIEAAGLLLLAFAGGGDRELLFGAFVLMGLPGLTIMLVPYQIAGDCADYAKWKTGTESRAVHVSLISLTKKFGAIWAALSVGLAGILGFDPGATVMTDDAMFVLKGLGLYTPAAMLLLGMLLVARFPITRRRQLALVRRTDLRAADNGGSPEIALASAARSAGRTA